MPSKSAKQHRLMEAVAHDPKFARKAGIPQKVGKEFARADQRSSVVAKRAANNKGKRGHGLTNRVTDNDPMEKDSESNWP
ncbi:MAG: hypothetical protein ACRD3F_15220 [Acidobacteriaceae bacterium]